ncbi:MAG: hypothetical protein QOG59_899, partial [Solirubrobacteraceae bacterium]|nr:hypothetical protein [Solirubrobacteraceae bacterium]
PQDFVGLESVPMSERGPDPPDRRRGVDQRAVEVDEERPGIGDEVQGVHRPYAAEFQSPGARRSICLT